MTDRADLKRQFKERKVPMGVLLIRNRASNRFVVRPARNLQAAMNRLQVEVTPSTNPDLALQADWRALGPAGFEVRVLDELAPKDEPGWSPDEELAALAQLWRERLIAEGAAPY